MSLVKTSFILKPALLVAFVHYESDQHLGLERKGTFTDSWGEQRTLESPMIIIRFTFRTNVPKAELFDI